jgi:hypothetical protein
MQKVMCLALLLSIHAEIMAFEINKDSVDFTDNSQSICLINHGSSIIRIDTIKLFKVTKSDIISEMFLSFDTGSFNGRYGPQAPCCYNNAYFNGEMTTVSYLVFDSINTDAHKIEINANDSVKLFNGCLISEVVSTLNKRLALQDTLRMVMISSNNERDSLIAIIPPRIVGRISNKIATKQYVGNSNTYCYLSNGKLINNIGVLKPNKLIKRASSAPNHDKPAVAGSVLAY